MDDEDDSMADEVLEEVVLEISLEEDEAAPAAEAVANLALRPLGGRAALRSTGGRAGSTREV